MIPTRTYDRWGGALLAALGVVGLYAGIWIGPVNSETVLDLLRITAGVLLLWAGTRAGLGQGLVWTKVVAVGFLGLGLAALVDADLFGLLTYELSRPEAVLYLLYGIAGLGTGWRVRVPA